MTPASLQLGELAARLLAASERDNALELRDALEVGQSIHYGRYLIQGVLGRGSYATVYDAEHVGLGRRVAIKVPRLRPDKQPALHERFVREARTSALVQHRNVLGIYDCGSLPDGSPFLVLERVNGDSLNTVIDRGPLDFAMVIELGRQLARALTALADVGVVHRDIKPENVMLHRTKFGIMVVKLVDFGVAKRSTWQAPMTITLQGELVGTPAYMAPEQLCGEEVDGRTDIYAVAAVLYEALTGRAPHESPNFSDYLVSALSTPPKPVRELRADCPASLEKILTKALQRDRTLRQNTPEQLLEELEACMIELKLDGPARRAAAHAMAVELEADSHDDGHERISTMLSHARKLMSSRLHIELSEPWQHRVDDWSERVAMVLHHIGLAARRMAPNAALLCVLTALFFFSLLLFSHSVSLVWPDEYTSPAAPLPARREPSRAPLVEPAPAPLALEIREPAEPAPEFVPPVSMLRPTRPTMAAPPPVRRAPPSDVNLTTSQPLPRRVTPPVVKPASEPASEASAAAKEPVAALLTQAFAAYVSSRHEEARSRYEQVLRSEPNNAAALRGLGLSAAQLGDKATARNSLRRYLQISPHASDAAAIEQRLATLTP